MNPFVCRGPGEGRFLSNEMHSQHFRVQELFALFQFWLPWQSSNVCLAANIFSTFFLIFLMTLPQSSLAGYLGPNIFNCMKVDFSLSRPPTHRDTHFICRKQARGLWGWKIPGWDSLSSLVSSWAPPDDLTPLGPWQQPGNNGTPSLLQMQHRRALLSGNTHLLAHTDLSVYYLFFFSYLYFF